MCFCLLGVRLIFVLSLWLVVLGHAGRVRLLSLIGHAIVLVFLVSLVVFALLAVSLFTYLAESVLRRIRHTRLLQHDHPGLQDRDNPQAKKAEKTQQQDFAVTAALPSLHSRFLGNVGLPCLVDVVVLLVAWAWGGLELVMVLVVVCLLPE